MALHLFYSTVTIICGLFSCVLELLIQPLESGYTLASWGYDFLDRVVMVLDWGKASW